MSKDAALTTVLFFVLLVLAGSVVWTRELKKQVVRRTEDLRASEEQHRMAVSAANEGIWDWHLDTNITHFDSRYYTMAGYAPHEFPCAYDEWEKRVHVDDIARAKTAIAECLTNKCDTFDVEFRFLRKDGEYMWIRGKGKIVSRAANGSPTRFVGTHSDITDRKRVEESLRLSSLVLNQIEDRVTVTDLEGHITYINDADCRRMGKPREELIGQHVSVYGEDPAAGATQEDIIRETLANGTWRCEIVNYSADGSRMIVDCRTHIVRDDAGKPIALCGVSTDITERKRAENTLRESESRLRVLFEQAADAIYVCDINGVLTQANEQACRIMGYTEDELLGMNIIDIDADFTTPDVLEGFARTLSPGRGVTIESRHRRKDGSVFPVEVTLSLLDSVGGLRVLGLVRDITARKRAEDELKESGERLNAFMDSATDAFTIWDADLNLIDLNKTAATYLPEGMRQEDAPGIYIAKFMPDSVASGRFECYRDVIRTGAPITLEARVLCPACGERMLNIRAFKVGDGLGIMTTDVTEAKRARRSPTGHRAELPRDI